MALKKDSQIIICGAGPVGLLLALKFAQAGLDVTIVESESEINDSPRACVYAPASLEGLDSVGLYDDIKKISHINQTLGFRSKDHDFFMTADTLGDGPYDRTFHVGQEEIGAVIVKHLSRHNNVQILWNTRLTAFEQNADGVTVHLETSEGEQAMVANWLVGTDGANSTVRRLAGIEFEGHTWEDRFFATNVSYEFGNLGYGDGIMNMDPHSYAVIVRVNAKGVWRIAFGEPTSIPYEGWEERARSRLGEFIPEGEKYDLLRLNPYNIHQRAATTLRQGRVLLAGDAAHATNPVGGLGLTTGTWDALILGDLLPAVINGSVSEDALDAYSKERLRVFWEFTSPQATENKRIIQESDPARRLQDIEKIKGLLSSKDAQHFLPKMAYLTVGNPILENSPWQKYKDAKSIGIPMPPKA